MNENINNVIKRIAKNPINLKVLYPHLNNNYDIIKKIVGLNPMVIKYASDEIKNNFQALKELLNIDGNIIKYLSDDLKNSYNIACLAINNTPFAMEHLPNQLKNDYCLAMTALNNAQSNEEYEEILYIFRLIGDELKSNKKFILEVLNNFGYFTGLLNKLNIDYNTALEIVKIDGLALNALPTDLKKNFDVVLEAVKNNSTALNFATGDLKNDKNIVLEAINKFSGAFIYASNNMKHNKEIIEKAVTQNGKLLKFVYPYCKEDFFFIDKEILKNTKLIKELYGVKSTKQHPNEHIDHYIDMLKHNNQSLKWLKDFENYKLLIEDYVNLNVITRANINDSINKKNYIVLKSIDSQLEGKVTKLYNEYKDIVILSVKKNGLVLEDLPDDLKTDLEIVKLAVSQNGMALKYVRYHLKTEEIVKLAIQNNGNALKYAPNYLKNNIELNIIRLNWLIKNKQYEIIDNNILFYIWLKNQTTKTHQKSMYKNSAFINYAVQYNPYIILKSEIELSEELIIKCIQINHLPVLEYLENHNSLKNNCNIISELTQINGMLLKYSSTELRDDYAIVLDAVKTNGHAIAYASENLKDNFEIALEAVKQNGLSLFYLSERLKKDPKIILEAVKQNPRAIEYAIIEKENLEISFNAIIAVKHNTDNINLLERFSYIGYTSNPKIFNSNFVKYIASGYSIEKYCSIFNITKEKLIIEYKNLKRNYPEILPILKNDIRFDEFGKEMYSMMSNNLIDMSLYSNKRKNFSEEETLKKKNKQEHYLQQ